MKCPQCEQILVSAPDRCPKCQADLTVVRTILELKTAARDARAATESVAGRIRELENRIAALEPMIASRLAPASMDVDEIELETDVERRDAADIPTPVIAIDAPPAGLAEAPPTHAPIAMAVSPVRRRDDGVISRESELHFGQKWLLITGISVTVLAVGFFLKYSFDQNWVGPAGRVGLACMAGGGLLALGEILRRRNFDAFGFSLAGGGIAVLYFAAYAAFQIYQLIGQPVAFGLMIAVTCLAGFFALVYDTKWLAVLGIIGGFITPVVLYTNTDNQLALMTYMTILNAGILAIAVFKQWRLLNHLGLGFTWLLFTAWYVWHYADEKFWTTTIYLNIFFLAYAILPFLYEFVRPSRERVVRLGITIPNAAVAFGFSFAMIQSRFRIEAVGVVTLAYAAIFLAMAAYLYRYRREHREPFILLVAMGALFLAMTVPVCFSRHWISVFWALLGIAILWVSLRLKLARIRDGAIILTLLAVAKVFAYDYTAVFDLNIGELAIAGGFTRMLAERALTLGLAIAVLFAAARMLATVGSVNERQLERDLASLFQVLFGVALFLALNVESAVYFNEYAPRATFAAISVLWAVFAAVLMGLGFARNVTLLRRVAIGLFALTVVKVFVRDLADVDTPFRILSFLVVGLLLVVASYLYHRFAARILNASDDEAAQS